MLRTERPQARLRLTEFRGVSSATMIYDALPINDIFRMLDHNTLLGVMDLRGATKPFFFVLRRESASYREQGAPSAPAANNSTG